MMTVQPFAAIGGRVSPHVAGKQCLRFTFGICLSSVLLFMALNATRLSGQETITFDRIVDLLELEVKEERILKLVEQSSVRLTLGAAQVETLRSKGASDTLLKALQANTSGLATDQLQDITDFILILDCSGSMSDATPEGPAKWQVAKEAAFNLIGSIPNGRNVSLIVYGHDKALACQAVQVLRPLAPLSDTSREKLVASIEALAPTANTPIALALTKAREELSFSTGLSKVLLITDGLETCNGDPVAVAALLANDQRLVGGVDVIGFAVSDEEAGRLSQIAVKGNGTYFDAKNATGLKTSVRLVQQALAQPVTGVQVVKSEVRPSKDMAAPAALELGKYVSGRLARGASHFWTIDLPAGEYVAICDGRPADGKSSNVIFSVRMNTDPLLSVNQINRIERGATRFQCDGGTKVFAIQNNTEISDYNFVLYGKDTPLPFPYITVPNQAPQSVELSKEMKFALAPDKISTRSVFYKATLPEGDYEIELAFTASDAKGNFGAVLDRVDELGVKVERIGYSYNTNKSQAVRARLIVAEDLEYFVKVTVHDDHPINGFVKITRVTPAID